MSLAIWFDLGGDASLVVGVVTVRVETPTLYIDTSHYYWPLWTAANLASIGSLYQQ